MRKAAAGPPSYTRVFSDALIELANEDPRIVAITAAMPDGTGLERFQKVHPDRYYDVGIAEQHAVTFAARARDRGHEAGRRDLFDVPAARPSTRSCTTSACRTST